MKKRVVEAISEKDRPARGVARRRRLAALRLRRAAILHRLDTIEWRWEPRLSAALDAVDWALEEEAER